MSAIRSYSEKSRNFLMEEMLRIWTALIMIGIIRFLATGDYLFVVTFFSSILLISTLIPWILMKQDKYQLAGYFQVFPTWLILSIALYFIGGFRSQTFFALIPILLLSLLYFNRKIMFGLISLTLINGLIVAILQQNDMLPPSNITIEPLSTYITIVIVLTFSGVILYYYDKSLTFADSEIKSLYNQNTILIDEKDIARYSEVKLQDLSHHFKNLLHAISIQLEMLEIEMNNTNLHILETSSYHQIDTLIQQGSKTIREALQFTPEAKFETSEENIMQLKNLILTLSTNHIPQRIGVRISKFTKCKININLEQFERIIFNLLNNVVDAIQDNGSISINHECKYIQTEFLTNSNEFVTEDRYEIISVEDSGSGIPAEIRDRIFLPHFSSKKEGNGIGLSSVKYLLNEQNCFIDFESLEGEFTRFIIYIPHLKN